MQRYVIKLKFCIKDINFTYYRVCVNYIYNPIPLWFFVSLSLIGKITEK